VTGGAADAPDLDLEADTSPFTFALYPPNEATGGPRGARSRTPPTSTISFPSYLEQYAPRAQTGKIFR